MYPSNAYEMTCLTILIGKDKHAFIKVNRLGDYASAVLIFSTAQKSAIRYFIKDSTRSQALSKMKKFLREKFANEKIKILRQAQQLHDQLA